MKTIETQETNNRVSALDKLRLRSESVTEEDLKQIEESLWEEIQLSCIDQQLGSLDEFLLSIRKEMIDSDRIDNYPEAVAEIFQVEDWRTLDYLKEYTEDQLRSKNFIKTDKKLVNFNKFVSNLLGSRIVSTYSKGLQDEVEMIDNQLGSGKPINISLIAGGTTDTLSLSDEKFYEILKPFIKEATTTFQKFKSHLSSGNQGYLFPGLYDNVSTLSYSRSLLIGEVLNKLTKKVRGIPKGFEFYYDLGSDSFLVLQERPQNEKKRKAANFVKLGDLATTETDNLNTLAKLLVKDKTLASYKEKIRKIAESGLKRKYTAILRNPPTFESVLRGTAGLTFVGDDKVLDYLDRYPDYDKYIDLAKREPDLKQQERMIDLLVESIKRG